MKQAYRELAELFRAAAEDLRAGLKGTTFPPGSFPPGLPYVPASRFGCHLFRYILAGVYERGAR